MIGYATLGTNDIDAALAFYDALFAVMGGKRLLQMPDERRITFYGVDPGAPMLAITRPHDGRPATAGNGTMIALVAQDRVQVDALHAKALAMGGADEGAPGPRGPAGTGRYGGYFRDPDGNKLAVYTIGQA